MNKDDNEQILSLTRDFNLMRERYLNLVNIHGEIQKQNSILEERILDLVETYTNEKSQLEENLTIAKQKIIYLEDTVKNLEYEKQRYKDDCNLAVNLLHQKPNEYISEQVNTNQSQHSVIIPTFPPIFVASVPLINTKTTITNDNLQILKLNPNHHFICSNCQRTIKYADVSVQTSLDNHDFTSQKYDEFTNGTSWLPSMESPQHHHHHQAHMTVKEYQNRNIKNHTHNNGLSLNSIPQMHHV